ncbi:MAG: imidazoleglycerol-phosphate dehydratase HisB [Clostridiales bacterium]|jgi:imidazoleglycerol-phosphate dehydratase|nr:imidazoleglycerol-phosphate dehydratase HisB [Clostridiales bacterium]
MYRKTNETEIEIKKGTKTAGEEVETGIGFFDHMLQLLLFRAGLKISIKAKGDLHVDGHHTVEDVGILLGKYLDEMLGDKSGIMRYGSARVPMDESLSEVTVDLDVSGRAFIVFNAEFNTEKCGDFEVELAEEFFRALAMNAKITIHINLLYGKNTHHEMEAIFKGFGLALKQAITPSEGITSTKGLI